MKVYLVKLIHISKAKHFDFKAKTLSVVSHNSFEIMIIHKRKISTCKGSFGISGGQPTSVMVKI